MENAEEMVDAEIVHMLAFPFPVTGHLNSLMHLCKSLASPPISFKITFLCTEEGYETAVKTRDSGVAKLDDKINIVASGKFPSLEDLFYLQGKMEVVMEELIKKLSDEGNPVVCILCDTFTGWVQDVANKFRIPRAVLWTSNAINDVLQMYVPELMARGFMPVTVHSDPQKLIDFIPGIPPMPATDLPFLFQKAMDPFVYVVYDGAKRFFEAEFALCNTFEELESDVVTAIRSQVKSQYYCIGPCLSMESLGGAKTTNSLSVEDTLCLEWLDKQSDSSVIYVAFGSMAHIGFTQAKEIATGLENAGQPFLLVYRKNMISDDDKEATDFFNNFVDRSKHKGLVVSWAPQMQVLSHPAVGGFFTHCGWNSTLEAICSGVPLLAWPLMAEQNVNCREIVGRWKIGIEVPTIVSGEVVTKLVKKLMVEEEGKEMREKAGKLQELAKNAVSEGGSSLENLKEFAKAVRKRVSSSSV